MQSSNAERRQASIHICAIVAAAGHGTRLGRPKQLIDLLGKPVVAWCLQTLGACDLIDDIVVVSDPAVREPMEAVAAGCCGAKLSAVIEGGARRQDSVHAALRIVKPETDFVLVHDGARPFVTQPMIRAVIEAARVSGAAVVAVPVKDTIKQAGEGGTVTRTIPREQLWAAQTPQAFAFEVLYAAYAQAEAEGFVGTDDAMLVERAGSAQVRIVEGSHENVKITTPEDLFIAERIARSREAAPA